MLTVGSPVPEVVLRNQQEEAVDLATLREQRVLIFFYPKANTPGCTQQACGRRDVAASAAGTVLVGTSPADTPTNVLEAVVG